MQPARRQSQPRAWLLIFISFGFLFVDFESVKAKERPDCSSDFFAGDCRDDSKSLLDLRKSTADADGVLFNYSWILQSSKAPLIAAFNSLPTKAIQDKGLSIAEDARSAAIRYVSGGQPEDSWSPHVKATVLRLQLLKFRISAPTSSDCFATGDPGIPNARYRYHEHTVGICPASLKIPTAELVATLAHEIGHSVSPCMITKSLVRYKNADREYGVDVDPKATDELVSAGDAERVPSSDAAEPAAFRTFNSCIDLKYKAAYENWLAHSNLRLEKLPTELSPRLQKTLDAAREKTPLRCFETAEEHFADSFGAFVYDAWSTAQDLSKSVTTVGLHFLTNWKCAQDLNPAAVQFQNLHTSAADRISLYLKPRGTAARVGCTPVEDKICSLSEATFSGTGAGSGAGTPTEGAGTKR